MLHSSAFHPPRILGCEVQKIEQQLLAEEARKIAEARAAARAAREALRNEHAAVGQSSPSPEESPTSATHETSA